LPWADRDCITAVGAQTAYIEPGSLWTNGYVESVNARFRNELRSGEIFYPLRWAQNLIERWRVYCNTVRPHGALGYRPPALETVIPTDQRPDLHQRSNLATRSGRTSFSGDVASA
jgi:transposase InsO family protein